MVTQFFVSWKRQTFVWRLSFPWIFSLHCRYCCHKLFIRYNLAVNWIPQSLRNLINLRARAWLRVLVFVSICQLAATINIVLTAPMMKSFYDPWRFPRWLEELQNYTADVARSCSTKGSRRRTPSKIPYPRRRTRTFTSPLNCNRKFFANNFAGPTKCSYTAI